MKRILYSAIGVVLLPLAMHAGGLADTFGLGQVSKQFFIPKVPTETAQKIFTTVTEDKQTKLIELEREKQQLVEREKQFLTTTVSRIEETKSQIDLVNESLHDNPDNEFFNKKLAILNEHYHVLKELQQLWEQLIVILDQSIKLLHEYVNDPSLISYKKELKLEERALSFEDLEQLNQLIQEQEKTIAHLVDQEKNADAELVNRKRTAEATTQAYKRKKEEQAALGKAISAYYSFDLSRQQSMELLKLEEQLYTDKKERDDLRFSEIEHKKYLIKIRLFSARMKLDVLKDTLKRIKPAVTVSEADVLIAKDDLAKKRQELFAIKETYSLEIDAVTKELRELDADLEAASKKYTISLGVDLADWSREPKRTVAGYQAYLEVAVVNDAVQLLHRKKEYLESHIVLEDEKIDYESIYSEVKESFHKITAQSFMSDDAIRQEIKRYDAPKAEAKANLSLYAEKRNAAHELLNRQKKALDRIKERRQALQQQRNSLFKGQNDEYIRCLELLNNAQESLKSQIELISKMISIYGDIIVIVTKTVTHIDFIVDELSSITVWQRPEHAISWQGLVNFVPSLKVFLVDVGSYAMQVNPQTVLSTLVAPRVLGWFFVYAIIIVLLLLVRSLLAPVTVAWALGAQRMQSFFMRYVGILTAELVEFIRVHLIDLAVWLYLFYYTYAYIMHDPYPFIFVCLGSIFYCIYLTYNFIERFLQVNVRYNYVFLSPDYQRRFTLVISTLAYVTIGIYFFRQAFTLGNYLHSELPTILLGINWIIFQISCMLLISKEHIMRLIPERDGIFSWLREQVDRYFYLLIAIVSVILVMSNPYVGFDKLVLYVIINCIYTVLLCVALIWFNILIKRAASYVFFHVEEGVMRERFAYGKTLYSLFTISLFLICIFIGCIVGAKIWGWPDQLAMIAKWSDVVGWLAKPIILENTETPISVLSILNLLVFVMGGFVVSFVINNFVMAKIFDVLLVDTGVQNTAARITRYLIVMTAVILGFNAIGLGGLVSGLIVAFLVGIGWVIKDPVGDFIAYFIILVQRPIKIGDYIRIDDENLGVVRKITPRSVVIRRKNSTTLIIPNSTVINKPVANWNYQRGFVAFDDIVITISYKEDPAQVKAILYKVLDENPYVLKSPKPIVRLDNFGDFGFVFMARGFLSSNYTLDQWDIASDVRLEMVKVLRAHHIHIAIPARIMLGKTGFDAETKDQEALKE